MTKQRYFGATDEKNDKEYLKSFIGKQKSDDLETLKIGEFFYKKGRIIERVKTPLFKPTVVPMDKVVEIKKTEPPPKEMPTQVLKQTDDNFFYAFIITVMLIIMTMIYWLYSKTH